MGIFGSAGRSVGGGRSTPSGGSRHSAKVSHPTAAGAAAVRKGGSAPGQSTPAEELPWSPAPYDPDGDPVDGEGER